MSLLAGGGYRLALPFPHLPHRSELHRRTRWLWGALEQLREYFASRLGPPVAGWEQLDTTPLPVKHPSRVRGPDWWVGPPGSNLTAGFGACAAKGKHAWFYGFRLALRTGLLNQVPQGWSIVPGAVDEREAGEDLVREVPVAHLLADRGFHSKRWEKVLQERGTTLLTST